MLQGTRGKSCRALHQCPAACACLCTKLARSSDSQRAGAGSCKAPPPSRAVKIEIFLQILDETDTNIPPQDTRAAQALPYNRYSNVQVQEQVPGQSDQPSCYPKLIPSRDVRRRSAS